ncbi:MAG: transporter substrate-binding protein [Ramlibacter sp.]|jgi:branched-chain amino acid transport system substrate-binding protein|nr:transporter substrate-binding protein [Ramlibacter sp.]
MQAWKWGAVVALAAAGSIAHAQEKLKIGFLSSFSGPLGALATDMEDGFKLGIKHAGGRLGGLETEVINGDDQQNPDVGRQVFDKMVKRDRVQIVTGTMFTNTINVIAPTAFKEKVFFVNLNNGNAPFAGEQCNPYYFSVGWQGETPAEAVGKFATDKGYKNIYVVAPNFPAGQANVAGFKRFYKAPTAGENFVKIGQIDFSVEIAQIRAAKPDAVYLYLFGGMATNFIKQYAQAGLSKEIPLIGGGFSFDDDTIQGVGDALVGSYNAWWWNRDLDNPANKRFVADFQAQYKRLPTLYSTQGYEAAMLIDSAVRGVNGKISDKDALRAAFRKANFKSVRGNFRFGPNQHPIQTFYLRQVVNEKGSIHNKTVSTLLPDHADFYASQCKMN